MSKANCNKHFFLQKSYVLELYNKKIITKMEKDHAIAFLNKWKIDCSHSFAFVTKYDEINNTIKEYYFAITKSSKDVTIIKSLSENYFGEKSQTFKVLKINDNLYITSHSLIQNVNLTELKFGELKYDPAKDCYVDMDNSKITAFENLTKENVDKMGQYIIDYIESTDIKKVDISNAGDIINDVVALKYLESFKKGTFDKATYEEIGEEMAHIDAKYTQIEKNIITLLKSNEL